MTDTSTQAMEAIAEYLEVLRQPYWADKVRIVAAERDNARRTALEDAAKAGRKAVNDCRENEETNLRVVREWVSDAIRALIDGEKDPRP